MSKFSEGSRAAVAGILALALAGIAVFAIGIMAVFGVGWFTDATADRQGETSKKQQVEANGQYRIAAYDKFFDQCAAVQTAEVAIKNTQRDLTTTTDAGRKMQLQANLSAQQNQRAELINTYNQDARKSYTLGQFKASDLPGRLNINDEETTCTA